MLHAACPMLRGARLGLGIPDGRRIRRRAGGGFDCFKLSFRPRASTREAATEGRRSSDSLRWTACFRDPTVKGKKLETESVRGGEDIWDADSAAEQGSFPEHLVVMVNGLVGSAADWRFAAEQFVKKLPDKVIVHH